MAEEFRIEVPFGGRDELTPVIDRAERRFRHFRNFMRRETAAMRREQHAAFGGPQIGPQQAGQSFRRMGVQPAAARFQRLRGGQAFGGMAAIPPPSMMARMNSFMRQNVASMRQLAPLTQRAFAPIAAAGFMGNARGLGAALTGGIGRISGSNLIGGIGMGGGLARAGAPFSAAGRVAGGVARGVGGTARGVSKALSPANLFTAAAVGYAAQKAGAMAFGGPMELAGQMEQAEITFETLTGSISEAQKMMKFLFDFAEKTPLRFGPIREWGQALLQWGFAAERIPKLMTAIASAASAMPEPEVAGAGITRALGQMRLRGRVLMEEINQLQDQGVPALEMLAKAYGVSTNEIIRWMETGARPAVLVGKQLRGGIDIITEGIIGRYPGMLEKQSKTLLGMWNTIQDIFQMRMVLPWGQGLAEGVQPVLANLLKWFDENKESVAAIGAMFKEWGKTLSTAVAGKIQEIVVAVAKLFGSEEWKNAKTFGEQFGVVSGKVGELLWGTGEGNKGLVQGVMDWVKDRPNDMLAWGKDRWTDFTNMVGEKIQTWTTWTAERINELKAEALKKFTEIVDYFQTTFQDTIVKAIQAIIPWFKDPRGGGPGAPGGGAAAAGTTGGPFEGLGTTPTAGGGVSIAAGSSALTVPQTQDFLRQYGFDEKTIASACGPIAAAGLARAFGVAVSPEEMIRKAPQFGWRAGPGMGGYQNFRKMVASMGLETSVISQEEAVAAMARGEPITMSTPQHYFLGQGIDPTRGINVGNTGAMFGSEYMSLNDIARHGRGRPTYIRTTRPGGAPISAPVGGAAAIAAAQAAGGGGSTPVAVEVGEVTVTTSPHEDPAAVNQAVADGFAEALAGSLAGAFANMPQVTR